MTRRFHRFATVLICWEAYLNRLSPLTSPKSLAPGLSLPSYLDWVNDWHSPLVTLPFQVLVEGETCRGCMPGKRKRGRRSLTSLVSPTDPIEQTQLPLIAAKRDLKKKKKSVLEEICSIKKISDKKKASWAT